MWVTRLGALAPFAIVLLGPQVVPFFMTLAVGSTLLSAVEWGAGAAAHDQSHVQAGGAGTALGFLSIATWGAVGSPQVPASTGVQAAAALWASTGRWFMQEVIGRNV
jgi:hypothetical protein